MRILHAVLTVLLLAASLAAFAADKPKYDPPTKEDALAVMKQGRYLVTITMENNAKIEVVLEGEHMPYTVANFVKLAKAKFYDGLTFHRVQADFVIQGGDPNGDGSGGPGYNINLELSPFLSHKKGAISMASRPAPNTAGSQFFIMLKDTPYLDGRYAVFGWVKSGMDVVEKVKVGDKIKTVTAEPYKGTEKNPVLVSGSTPDDGKH